MKDLIRAVQLPPRAQYNPVPQPAARSRPASPVSAAVPGVRGCPPGPCPSCAVSGPEGSERTNLESRPRPVAERVPPGTLRPLQLQEIDVRYTESDFERGSKLVSLHQEYVAKSDETHSKQNKILNSHSIWVFPSYRNGVVGHFWYSGP